MATDLDTLRRKAQAARRHTVALEDGAVSFELLLPTRHESSVIYARVAVDGGERDQAAMLRWQRAMLLAAVTGWAGVQEQHVLAGAPADALPFEPAALELVLDAQPQWEQQLTTALLEAVSARRAPEEAAAKNS